MRCKAVGWVMDSKGKVVRYSLNDVCNCLTTFCGENRWGGLAPNIAIVYEK